MSRGSPSPTGAGSRDGSCTYAASCARTGSTSGRGVPAGRTASGTETGYLPFEGDRTLALILSKAMMLADDTGITDPTITRQILSERA
ncbi:hypothetical protein OG509_23300 [Streptomyces sp. NBC_01006]|nr:hypothetical protein OG509_23300 [Streptomyces sp. NBC_01006]